MGPIRLPFRGPYSRQEQERKAKQEDNVETHYVLEVVDPGVIAVSHLVVAVVFPSANGGGKVVLQAKNPDKELVFDQDAQATDKAYVIPFPFEGIELIELSDRARGEIVITSAEPEFPT